MSVLVSDSLCVCACACVFVPAHSPRALACYLCSEVEEVEDELDTALKDKERAERERNAALVRTALIFLSRSPPLFEFLRLVSLERVSIDLPRHAPASNSEGAL